MWARQVDPLAGVGIALLALACAVLASAWPTMAILLPLLGLACGLALRAPLHALLLAVLVLGFVGTIKARFLAEGVPSSDEVGAVLIDLFLLAAFVGIVARDRGRALRALWRSAGGVERIVWSIFVAWLALSVVQVAQGDRLVDALQGFRLTQAYVAFLIVGLAVASLTAPREDRFVKPLLVVLGIVSAYAVLRTVTGPTAWEKAFALERSGHSMFEDLSRTLGSFSSPTEIASFLVPVAAFALTVGCLHVRLRVLGLVTFLLATVAVVASYVRVGVVAIAVAATVLAVVVVASRATSRLTKLLALALVVLVAGGTYAGALVAADKTDRTSVRARGFSDPLSDDSLKTRWRTWTRTVEQIRDEPLGTGLGTVGNAAIVGRRESFTDNYFLKVAREQGILGALLFVVGLIGALVLLAVRLTRGNPLERPLAVAALTTGAAMMTISILGEYLEGPGKVLLWVVLGLGLWDAYVAPGRAAVAQPEPTPDATRPGHALRPRAGALAAGTVLLLSVVSLVLTLGRPDRPAAEVAVSAVEPERLAGTRLVGRVDELLGDPRLHDYVATRWGMTWPRTGLPLLDGETVVRAASSSARTVDVEIRGPIRRRAERLARLLAAGITETTGAEGTTQAEARTALRAVRRRLAQPGLGAAQREDLRLQERYIEASLPGLARQRPLRGRADAQAGDARDRVADALPGDGPPRPSPVWAALAGGLAAGLCWLLWLLVRSDRPLVPRL
jgi:O-Antigen ligase